MRCGWADGGGGGGPGIYCCRGLSMIWLLETISFKLWAVKAGPGYSGLERQFEMDG